MTTLREVFNYLTSGELQQTAVGLLVEQELGPQADIINMNVADYISHAKNMEKVVGHVNLALTALYTRFWLATGNVIIQQYDHIQQYWLQYKYAETNKDSEEKIRYIKDSIYEPFLDDCLKIEEVFDEDGRGLYLNDLTQPWSVFTPTYNSVQVPYPMYCNHLLVHYRANHPKLSMYEKILLGPGGHLTGGKKKPRRIPPEDIEIFLPEGFMEPLLFYVGSRALGSLNVDNNAEGNNYLQKYENSCKRLETSGLQITPHYGNHKLDLAGWP